MSVTMNAKTYAPDSYGANAVVYFGPLHTLSVKDDLRLSRVAPKPTATFSGVGRVSAKHVRTYTLTGALTPTWDSIWNIDGSIPVGAASADIDVTINDLGSYIASAPFKLFAKLQQITF